MLARLRRYVGNKAEVGSMRRIRIVLAAILAVGLLASGVTSVSANDTPNTEQAIPPGPGLIELRHAIDEFRAALADLRDACKAERMADVGDVTTARKRLPKGESECEKQFKLLKAEFAAVKQAALELEAKYIDSVKQQRIDAVKQKEEAAKAKLAEEQRKFEDLQKDQAKKESEKKAAELKPVWSPTDELAKKRAKLEEQLKSVDSTLAYKQGLWKQSVDAANEYRAKAATLTGADKEKYLAKAAQADKDAAQWAGYVKEYMSQHERLVAELAKLGTVAAPAPKPNDTATKRAKLEQAFKELNDKITYKWSESDRYAAYASDLRAQAAIATGELKEKLLAKAAEADKAADDWANLARQYEDEREKVQSQLDALPKT
jgi:hypothetical protein